MVTLRKKQFGQQNNPDDDDLFVSLPLRDSQSQRLGDRNFELLNMLVSDLFCDQTHRNGRLSFQLGQFLENVCLRAG